MTICKHSKFCYRGSVHRNLIVFLFVCLFVVVVVVDVIVIVVVVVVVVVFALYNRNKMIIKACSVFSAL